MLYACELGHSAIRECARDNILYADGNCTRAAHLKCNPRVFNEGTMIKFAEPRYKSPRRGKIEFPFNLFCGATLRAVRSILINAISLEREIFVFIVNIHNEQF